MAREESRGYIDEACESVPNRVVFDLISDALESVSVSCISIPLNGLVAGLPNARLDFTKSASPNIHFNIYLNYNGTPIGSGRMEWTGAYFNGGLANNGEGLLRLIKYGPAKYTPRATDEQLLFELLGVEKFEELLLGYLER